jgi:hypothetical protein
MVRRAAQASPSSHLSNFLTILLLSWLETHVRQGMSQKFGLFGLSSGLGLTPRFL